MNDTKNVAVKWIYDNAHDVKNYMYGCGVLDVIIIALVILGGNVIGSILFLIRLIVVEILLFVPAVKFIQFIKKEL